MIEWPANVGPPPTHSFDRMQLTLRQAASYLGVSEATARRWITRRDLPVHHAHERLYLNPVELWEWAVEHHLPVSRNLLDHARRSPDDISSLADLLRSGGIHYNVPGADKAAVLREVVARLPLPPETDRGFLVSVLEAREAMGSTGVGGGIAIPHVRNPIVLHVEAPFVTLCLLEHPVDFDAIDGKPVHALFTVVTPTVPVHLRVLAELGFVLRDDELKARLQARAPADDIVGRVELLEAEHSGAFAVMPAPSRPARR